MQNRTVAAGEAPRVLLVTASGGFGKSLARALEAGGFRVETISSLNEARQQLAVQTPSVAILDLASGMELTQSCQDLVARTRNPLHYVPLIVMHDDRTRGWAEEMKRRGSADLLLKPFLPEDLVSRARAAVASVQPLTGGASAAEAAARPLPPRKGPGIEQSAAAPGPGGATGAGGLILGTSPAIRGVIDQVRLVAPKNTTVLITGETGTGKERVARAIHALSRRASQPRVSVNCGGVPANLLEDEFFGHERGAFTDAHQHRVGRFEQAHGGTIFLDEIGDLPLELQPKLLRVLQERELHRVGGAETIRIDVRVVAATNADLWASVRSGAFREDLFYRINVFPIHLPPLRERREDIPLFVEHFLEGFCRRDGLAPKQLHPAAEAELMSRPWPGNIRELENAVEIAVIRSRDRTTIDAADFPESRPPSGSHPEATLDSKLPADYKQIVSQFERDLITRVLERAHGNKSRAAEMLRIKRTTLIEKLKKLSGPPMRAG